MLYRPLGKLGWMVSAIGMGTWNIGNEWGEVSEETAWTTVQRAYKEGINLFDVAESYGNPHGLSEQRLGRALAGIRQNVVLVSKIGHWGEYSGQTVPYTTVDMIRLSGHASLGRLRTDWLDVVLCHIGNIQEPSVFLAGFEALKDEGAIRAYGISTDSLDVLKKFNAEGTCSVVEVGYSLLNRNPELEFLPYCQKNGIAVLTKGPLRRGLLAGKYDLDTHFEDTVRSVWNRDGSRRDEYEREIAGVQKLAQIVEPGAEMVTTALRYVISHPAHPIAIPGAKSPQQAAMNAAAGAEALSEAQRTKLIAAMG